MFQPKYASRKRMPMLLKKILLFALVVLASMCSLDLTAQFQSDWENNFANLKGFSDCVINPDSGEVVCLGNTDSGNLQIITSFDAESGEQLQLKVFPENLGIVNTLIYTGKDENYLMVGTLPVVEEDSFTFFTKLIDKNLNIINEVEYVLPTFLDFYPGPYQVDYTIWNNTITVSVYVDSFLRNVFFQLDLDGNIVIAPSGDIYHPPGYDIVANPVDSTFKVIYQSSYSISDSLEYIENSRVDRLFFPSSRIYGSTPWRDDVLIAASSAFNMFGHDHGTSMLYLIDHNEEIVNTVGMTLEDPSHFGEPAEGRPMAIDQDSNIYLVNVASLWGANARELFSIAKFDKELNTLWQHSYSDVGDHRYWIFGVLPKPDGGIILYGTRTNWTQIDSFEGYMVCFDSNGNVISSTEDISDNMPFEMSINSLGRDNVEVIFNEHTSGVINIYDMAGKSLHSQIIDHTNRAEILATNIPDQLVVFNFLSLDGKHNQSVLYNN